MQLVKCVLILCITFQLISDALTIFSGSPAYDDDGGDDDIPMVHHFHTDPDTRGFERMMLRDMAEDEPEYFNEKEQRIRDALIRSTQDVRSQRKLYEMLPILRSLSREQRLTLAALIATQTNLKSAKSLDLNQVEEMFGERRNSILPIISEIANIVKRNMVENVNLDESARSMDSSASPLPSPSSSSSSSELPLSAAPPPPPPSHRSKRASKYEDDRPSYHERKFNMTNFRGTPESNDQHAIESQTTIHVSLPNSNTSSAVSYEEIENLALKDLNGTIPIGTDNNTNIENLPEPEMLIRPYRVRPRPISERFDNIYLYVNDYPINQIMGSIRRHRYVMTALLADNPNDWRSRMQEMENKKRREDESNNIPSSGMCPSLVRYARPQKARSASGEWKYIVNTGQHTQTLRLEKCTHPEQPCTYLTDNFSSRCVQVYNYHRLLSWDNKRGLHIDIFKVPTCCSCQIDGYREKFPPIGAHLGDDQELFETRFSASDALYSLANNDYMDNDNDSDDSPSNPIGTVYRPPITKKNRYEKRKKSKRPTSSLPDTYLTPPSPKYEPDNQFKRKQSSVSITNRASEETNATPVLIGNDETPDNDRPSKNGFTPIVPSLSSLPSLPSKTAQIPRLAPSKVLIKRVNYNYHPIIDFFFRDRAIKAAKAKENRTGHSIVS